MKPISVVFYTEAGTSRGMGHLVRCYTINEKFKEHNHKVEFYLDSDMNFDYKFKNLLYFTWDNLKYVKTYDVIIIDSYVASLEIYQKLHSLCKILVSIDDYGRLDYPKGIILNFAPDSKELFFKTNKEGYTYLLGLDYIPIREKILETTRINKKQIFIMLGGMDVSKLSMNILNAIDTLDIQKVIVLNDKDTALELEKIKNVKVLYKPSDDDLIQHMSNSTLAISTASMSIYELSYFNIPTIIVALNKNQQIGASQLLKHLLASKLLDMESAQWEKILKENIQYILHNNIQLNSRINGNGRKNIYENIMKMVNK
jgi:spore coat polysaccharide biosynthesis predicted glycosyltransferase SpsG